MDPYKEVTTIKTTVDDACKIVSFWLTREEQADGAVMASLKPLYAQWADKQYRCVVYCSGQRDLLAQTEGLLLHNRVVAAQRDLARQSEQAGPQ